MVHDGVWRKFSNFHQILVVEKRLKNGAEATMSGVITILSCDLQLYFS